MNEAKPFLKWAGGKRQLLPALEAHLPSYIFSEKDCTYVEPFVGSGAVLFWLLQKNTSIKKAIINDVNTRLTKAYSIIKKEPGTLIKALQKVQENYYRLDEAARKEYFLECRENFNSGVKDSLQNTVQLIFLNRTCFNGLYRVNRDNKFNVPFGRYNQPKICDEATIMADSKLLQRVTIMNGDYASTLGKVKGKAFFYFDPPYKPLNKTSSFNAYDGSAFDDAAQLRLRDFCLELHENKTDWLLSNSAPGAQEGEEDFFTTAYKYPGIKIDTVPARRSINSHGNKRQAINELLIYNYADKI
ncbi:MAG: Dam family site-specific DNA-(adenine-N6)-methyltransferase [Ferruginibacter sp.]